MTANESTTMREEMAAERERLAAEAFERIRTGQHWRDWTLVAAGFEAGRARAMREAGTNEPAGRRYNERFGDWMTAQRWPREIDKATRNHLLWVADHLPQLEAWRETLPASIRDAWNYPTTVKRQYARAMRASAARQAAAEQLSPMTRLKQELAESQEQAEAWKRRAQEGGSLFDLHKETVKDIARLIVDSCTPSRVTNLIKALREEQKARDKGLHAG
jgi:hypothetical protein